MTPLFKKLNFKAQPEIYVLQAPPSFQPELDAMSTETRVHASLARATDIPFAIAFATTQAQVDRFAEQVSQSTSPDAVLWVAYPKGTSKQYKCEFNRNTGWARFGELGLEPVRQVAIDDDWSALRFRRVENIKKMTRSFAISEAGKQRTSKSK